MNEQADKNAERGNFWSRRSRKGKTFIVIVGAFLALGTISAVASPSEEKASALPAPAVETVTQTVTEEAPVEEAPVEEAPVEEAPAEEAPAETAGQENARGSAEGYLEYSAFSRKGLIGQLEYEGYSTKDATYAVDAVSPDWNEQAAKSAKDYLDTSSFSRSGLIEQLEYEGYTEQQAVYGVNQAGL